MSNALTTTKSYLAQVVISRQNFMPNRGFQWQYSRFDCQREIGNVYFTNVWKNCTY